MEVSTDMVKEDLPFIFKLLESENEVTEAIESLQTEITQIENDKKNFNVDFHSQSHLTRNLIYSVLISIAMIVIFHFNFIFSFLIFFSSFTGYDLYKKNKIKNYIDGADNLMRRLSIEKNKIQDQFEKLTEQNFVYTSIIPEQYRNPVSVGMLFNYLYYGQADNLKEAYYLLDLEYRHQEQIGILKEHSSLLDENNKIAYEQLNQLRGLTSLQEQQLTAISELSRTAQNIDTTLAQTDLRVAGLEEQFVPKHKRKG